MTSKTIYEFALEAMSANSFEKAKELVMKVILASAHDNDLITEAMNYVNDEFMESSMDKNVSNQSELN